MRAAFAIVVGSLAAAVACSSVPDVQYLDLESDAGTTGSSGSSGDSGTQGQRYSCPDNPPPAREGICCGGTVCLKCSESNCDRCGRSGCNRGEACCARNATNVVCREQSACD